MAHGDYACCCICASKQDYEGFSENHKKRLCASCAVALMKHGVEATSHEEVLAWMRRASASEVVAALTAVGFHLCYYENEVDTLAASLAGNPDYKAQFATPHAMLETLLASLVSPPAFPPSAVPERSEPTS